ncbi:MAG: hypothetical protein AAFN74_20845, partial [Myxococcota bacterium]
SSAHEPNATCIESARRGVVADEASVGRYEGRRTRMFRAIREQRRGPRSMHVALGSCADD